MSDFWSSELGEVTGSAEDAFAKTFTRIPDGTMALARIEKFKNDLNDRTKMCIRDSPYPLIPFHLGMIFLEVCHRWP